MYIGLRERPLEYIVLKEYQVTIYHLLCTLIMEREEAKFCTLLQEFLTYIFNNHERFHNYFNANYCTCYRVESTVNTNMFFEAFHRVLKIVYLHHKQNGRVNSLLVALIKIARNAAFERMRKLEMGKNSHRIREIMKLHQSANKLSPTSITLINNKKWKVNRLCC